MLALFQAFVAPRSMFAQQAAPAADMDALIKKEGMEHSQIMKTLHVFTDVYGPRLTARRTSRPLANGP